MIDWFHVAMRFTVLKQTAKGISIPDASPDDPDDNYLRGYLWGGRRAKLKKSFDRLLYSLVDDVRRQRLPDQAFTAAADPLPRMCFSTVNTPRQR